MESYLRGRVYAVALGNLPEKYYLVVSNNQRNRALGSALAVRLTTSVKPKISSIVELPQEESFAGRLLCDDIVCIWEDDNPRDLGALSRPTMRQVDRGLKAALALE